MLSCCNCIWNQLAYQRAASCHKRKRDCIVVNDVRRREMRFNTIVRDSLPDCLTKFDCNLITVEWPIVSVNERECWAVLHLNQLHDSSFGVFTGISCCRCRLLDFNVIDFALLCKVITVQTARDQNYSFASFTHFFLRGSKKSILQDCRWQNERKKANEVNWETSWNTFYACSYWADDKARNYSKSLSICLVNAVDKLGKLWSSSWQIAARFCLASLVNRIVTGSKRQWWSISEGVSR